MKKIFLSFDAPRVGAHAIVITYDYDVTNKIWECAGALKGKEYWRMRYNDEGYSEIDILRKFRNDCMEDMFKNGLK